MTREEHAALVMFTDWRRRQSEPPLGSPGEEWERLEPDDRADWILRARNAIVEGERRDLRKTIQHALRGGNGWHGNADDVRVLAGMLGVYR